MFGLAGLGHYNEVASLLRWPLSEVSLYKYGIFRGSYRKSRDSGVGHPGVLFLLAYSTAIFR